MFAEAIESLLLHHCTPATVRAIEGGASAQPLASAIAEAGFFELLASEEMGGGDASWGDFFDVVFLCGAYPVPLPLAQTLAARAIAQDAAELPSGLITFAHALLPGSDRMLEARDIPVGRVASHTIAVHGNALVLLAMADAQRQATGVHGSLAMSCRWPVEAARPLAATLKPAEFQAIAALLHAGLLAGAMKRCFDLTMGYANERVQFGKSIGKFQAIQHQLSVMAEHVAAARMAAEAAFGRGGLPTLAACAVAKARTSEAVQVVASIAHAVHGAIGVTEEYDLQLYTRRLHEWRIAHGSESYWQRVLGQLVMESPQKLSADIARTLLP